MDAADPFSRIRVVGSASAPQALDRPEPPGLPGEHGGTARPDATADYLSTDKMPPASSLLSEPPAGAGHFDFLDPPRAPDELGWLAHYRVRRLLGEGGMGLVYEAEDSDLLRPVALKVIRPELASSPQAAQRFLLEARAMAALKHDHIVTIYQVGQQHGVPFLAMEYLQGISLYNWLDRGHKRGGGPGAAARPRDRRRPGRRPPAGPDPPGHQAGEHLAGGALGAGQDPRLRAGPSRGPRRPDHESRDGRGFSGVHGPGAGARRGRRRGSATCSASGACCTCSVPAGCRSRGRPSWPC